MCLSCFLLILFNFSTRRGPLKTKASLANRPPRQKDRLPSFGRNTLAFEDGIVPRTPVLSSHSSNDGFADSSHQVDTRSAQSEPSVPASVSPPVVPVRDEVEPVAELSYATDATDKDLSKKRARGADTEEDSTDPNCKRSRIQVVEE